MKTTILVNNSLYSWTVPINWENHVIIPANRSITVEGGENSIYEPYAEIKRSFTAEQMQIGEIKGIWKYNVDCKKRKAFNWNLSKDGQYDVILENRGDFEIEIFKFGIHGASRHIVPNGVKVVLRNVPVQHWLSRIESILVKPQRKMVSRLDAEGNPQHANLVPDVRYNRRNKEEILKLEAQHLQWRKDNLVVNIE